MLIVDRPGNYRLSYKRDLRDHPLVHPVHLTGIGPEAGWWEERPGWAGWGPHPDLCRSV